MAKSFRELAVWQASIDLSVLIYGLTESFPQHETYGLRSQMRRAAVSISSNIAEGAGRETFRDFRQFVITARGSNYELQTQLVVTGRLGYSSAAQLHEAEELAFHVGKMLNGLARYLRTKSTKATAPLTANN